MDFIEWCEKTGMSGRVAKRYLGYLKIASNKVGKPIHKITEEDIKTIRGNRVHICNMKTAFHKYLGWIKHEESKGDT